jgi:phage terminase large subunit-like protein
VTVDEAPADEAPAKETAAEEPTDLAGDALDLLWKRALDAWDDPKPHAALLELALQTERLPDLAGRYRALLDDAEKGAMAKKRIDAILAAATQMLMSMKTPKPTKNPPWLVGSALVVLIVTVGYLAWAIARR